MLFGQGPFPRNTNPAFDSLPCFVGAALALGVGVGCVVGWRLVSMIGCSGARTSSVGLGLTGTEVVGARTVSKLEVDGSGRMGAGDCGSATPVRASITSVAVTPEEKEKRETMV